MIIFFCKKKIYSFFPSNILWTHIKEYSCLLDISVLNKLCNYSVFVSLNLSGTISN